MSYLQLRYTQALACEIKLKKNFKNSKNYNNKKKEKKKCQILNQYLMRVYFKKQEQIVPLIISDYHFKLCIFKSITSRLIYTFLNHN